MSAMSHDAARLHDILSRTLGLLDRASTLVAQSGLRPPEEMARMLASASSEIRAVRQALDEAPPPAAPVEAQVLAPAPSAATANAAAVSVAAPVRRPRRWRLLRIRRKAFVVAGARDIGRLVVRLLLPWWLPRIELGALEQLGPQRLQRAQHRIRARQDAFDRMVLGPVLAACAVLAGTFYIVWRWNWDFSDLARVAMAAAAVWIAGNLLNLLWCRLRLLLSLLRLYWWMRAARRQSSAPR